MPYSGLQGASIGTVSLERQARVPVDSDSSMRWDEVKAELGRFLPEEVNLL